MSESLEFDLRGIPMPKHLQMATEAVESAAKGAEVHLTTDQELVIIRPSGKHIEKILARNHLVKRFGPRIHFRSCQPMAQAADDARFPSRVLLAHLSLPTFLLLMLIGSNKKFLHTLLAMATLKP